MSTMNDRWQWLNDHAGTTKTVLHHGFAVPGWVEGPGVPAVVEGTCLCKRTCACTAGKSSDFHRICGIFLPLCTGGGGGCVCVPGGVAKD